MSALYTWLQETFTLFSHSTVDHLPKLLCLKRNTGFAECLVIIFFFFIAISLNPEIVQVQTAF